MIRNKRIRTSNKEIFDKLNLLHFSPEVVFNIVEKEYLSRILNKINEEQLVLKSEIIGNHILVKKILPVNYRVEYKKL